MDIPLDLSMENEKVSSEDNFECLDLSIGKKYEILNENVDPNISLQFQSHQIPQSMYLDPEANTSKNQIPIETEQVYFEENVEHSGLRIGENYEIVTENMNPNISFQFQSHDHQNEPSSSSVPQRIFLDPEVNTSQNQIPIEAIEAEGTIHTKENENNSSRKRQRHPELWKKNQCKVACNTGQEYVNKKGKLIPSRKMGTGCDENCRLRCHQRISNENRQAIFTTYWKISNHLNQWQYISKHVENHVPLQRTTDTEKPQRQWSLHYSFPINGEPVKVCQTMFLQTLGISKSTVYTAVQKYIANSYVASDGRGRNKKNFRGTDEKKQNIRDHINMFPTVASHYTRERTKRKYLEQGLSVRHMHRLYTVWMEEERNGQEISSESYYRELFNSEFNLGFFIPKKDQCETCSIFTSANATEKANLKEDYDNHLRDKKIVRELKESDKKASKEENSSISFACFDLQKVLTTPKSEIGVFYYKRKLAVYNFTVYNGGDHEANCYVWDESVAKRGSNEISSSLLHYIDDQCKTKKITDFKFYSDNCSGQNKNRFLFAMYLYASMKYKVNITHRFLERGHTQNEGDSVHACIERASKGKELFIPEQWYQVIENAKKEGKKYKVVRMTQDLILDFKPLVDDNLWKRDSSGQNVAWQKVKEVSTNFKSPDTLYCKYNWEENFVIVRVTTEPEQPKRGRPRVTPKIQPKPAYLAPLRLSAAKLKDLLSLCEDLSIPSTYHSFYESLKPGNETVGDDTEFSDSE